MLNGISKAGVEPVALLAKLLACPAQRAARSVAVDQVGRLTGKRACILPDVPADAFPRLPGRKGSASRRTQAVHPRHTRRNGWDAPSGRTDFAAFRGTRCRAGTGRYHPAEAARVLRPERRFGTQTVIFVAAVLKINKICRHFYTIFSIIRKKLIGKAEETELPLPLSVRCLPGSDIVGLNVGVELVSGTR